MVTSVVKYYRWENTTKMDNTTQLNENQVNTPPVPTQEFPTTKVTSRKPLKEWGFEQAGLNCGDAASLECHLRWIQQGHIVDETYNADEEVYRKKQIGEQISQKEKLRNGLDKDQLHIMQVVVADKENQIAQIKGNIENKQIQMAEGTIKSNYSGARFWLYTALCAFITIYLVFFYSSAINASFFRNMQQMVNSGSNDDVTLMLNSIFDVKGIFQWGPQLIFTYLGAFIFFGFGILPHIFLHEKSKFSSLKVVMATIVCLVVDSLLAYKIDSGIHDLKTMMGVADASWVWYKSVNFYLVLAFGFGTYLLWGFMYEAALTEHEKKNVNVKAEIEIKGLKKRIREVENEIISQKENIKELQKEIEGLKIEIENLKKQLEQASLKPEELKRNMEHFYSGWLGFLNGSNNSNKESCEGMYKQFRESLNQQLN